MTTLVALIYKVEAQLSAAELYYGHGTDNALDEAAWLVLHAVGLSPAEPIENPDMTVSSDAIRKIENLTQQRITSRKPLAYLLQSAWFCGYEFYVDERVLVPRSPIAEMIEHKFSPWLVHEPTAILDLCCGSACIGIACAYHFEDSIVDVSDISVDALAVAEKNIVQHQLASRVHMFESDVFSGLPSKKYDLIISNPPYVDAQDMLALSPEYQNEPELGLAAGNDGLIIARQILVQALDFLSDQGILVVELGNSAEHLDKAYPQIPFTWVDFEYGGEGVFVISADELKRYQAELISIHD